MVESYFYPLSKRLYPFNGPEVCVEGIWVKDYILAPSESLNLTLKESHTSLIVPYAGISQVETSTYKTVLEEDEVLLLGPSVRIKEYKLKNILEDESSNLLIFSLKNNSQIPFKSFKLSKDKNLITNLEQSIFYLDLSYKYKVEHKNLSLSCFIFCLNGQVSVNNRLLSDRDIIVFKNETVFEFEALSQNASLIIFNY